jgi:two-component sensor histidine kinase
MLVPIDRDSSSNGSAFSADRHLTISAAGVVLEMSGSTPDRSWGGRTFRTGTFYKGGCRMDALHDRDGAAVDGSRIFLAELNHRVANELAAALAALRLVQRAFRDTTEPTGFLDQAVARLENFGQLHHILDPNRSHGSLAQRLELLCNAVSLAKAAPRGIRVALSADEVAVDDEAAWTICAVVSELLQNVLKHAFEEDGAGLVVVDLREERETIFLSVADNGNGGEQPATCDQATPGTGAGWDIVTELAARLGGSVSRARRSTGTTVTCRIPARRTGQWLS